MLQKHNIQLANFDMASLRVIWFRWARFWVVGRKVEVQEKTIAELKSGMTALAATVKEQAAQIQKVTAQIEMNKFACRTAGRIRRGGRTPQMVMNP